MAANQTSTLPALYVRESSTFSPSRTYSFAPGNGYRRVTSVDDLPSAVVEVVLYDTRAEANAFLEGIVAAGAGERVGSVVHKFEDYAAVLAIWHDSDPFDTDVLEEYIQVIDRRGR